MKDKSDANSKAVSKKSKKKKYKLQVMDIITIIFTAVILGVMGYVLYSQFAGDGDSSGNTVNNGVPTASAAASNNTATPAPTAAPVLSDIGNNYGNISNNAAEALIDGREYFISADSDGNTHIYMTDGENTRDLIKTAASSLNVVNDYITYADQKDVKAAYYVFYIDGDGKICYVTDGPITKDAEVSVPLESKVFLDGKYSVINVSGEFLYYLNGDGHIGKVSILDKTDTVLGSERAYSNFCLYYGVIYARGADDGFIYQMPSNPKTNSSDKPSSTASATASPTPSSSKDGDDNKTDESNEKLLAGNACTAFAIDNDWIYTVGDNGIVRYLVISGAKDTLADIKADAINVRNGVIYYTSGGTLYTAANAEQLLTSGAGTSIASVGGGNGEYGRGICAQTNTVYVTDENGVLMKSVYDKESKTYGELAAMN